MRDDAAVVGYFVAAPVVDGDIPRPIVGCDPHTGLFRRVHQSSAAGRSRRQFNADLRTAPLHKNHAPRIGSAGNLAAIIPRIIFDLVAVCRAFLHSELRPGNGN